jgi:16S rRNA (cytosine967-C5)-methyltransferase
VLVAVERGRSLDHALDDALAPLRPADRRLAHEIAAGVMRSRRDLDRRLAPLVRAPLGRIPAELRHILRIGAYQVTTLDRVPPYAAVQATVELAKRHGGRRAAGLVNAVLRRVASGSATPVRQPDEADAGDSHPAWLVSRWRERFGTARTNALLRHNDTRAAVVLQPARWPRHELESRLAAAGIRTAPAPFGDGIAVAGGRISSLPGYAEGGFYVQDPAQARLLDAAAVPAGARVWDACAAPGGKTARLALAGHPVIASDLRRNRLRRLQETVTRLDLRATLLLADARRPPLGAGAADVMLVDAPCTATGTMARHPDARWRVTPRRLAALVRLQSEILAGAASAVGAGGILVYMTCSLEREENEDQVTSFLQRHVEFAMDAEPVTVFPTDADTDGGFVARMRRHA